MNDIFLCVGKMIRREVINHIKVCAVAMEIIPQQRVRLNKGVVLIIGKKWVKLSVAVLCSEDAFLCKKCGSAK